MSRINLDKIFGSIANVLNTQNQIQAKEAEEERVFQLDQIMAEDKRQREEEKYNRRQAESTEEWERRRKIQQQDSKDLSQFRHDLQMKENQWRLDNKAPSTKPQPGFTTARSRVQKLKDEILSLQNKSPQSYELPQDRKRREAKQAKLIKSKMNEILKLTEKYPGIFDHVIFDEGFFGGPAKETTDTGAKSTTGTTVKKKPSSAKWK